MTASGFTRAAGKISQWCRQHRNDPIEEQHGTLCQKLRGHNAYHGITGNSPSLWRFREEVKRLLAEMALSPQTRALRLRRKQALADR